MAAARDAAESAMWRVDGFGVGEVRGLVLQTSERALRRWALKTGAIELPGKPGKWSVTAVRPVEGGVEVDAVRAPSLFDLGIPASASAEIERMADGRAPVAESAPLPTDPRCDACVTCDCPGSCAVDEDGLCIHCGGTPSEIAARFGTPHSVAECKVGKGEPAPAASDEPPQQPAPDRAAWLMLPVSLVGAETISGPRYNELASVARGLRARVAELEAANEGLAQIVNARAAAPPPGTVAALLRAVEDARATHTGGWFEQGYLEAMREAARLIAATLGAPTPLDRAVPVHVACFAEDEFADIEHFATVAEGRAFASGYASGAGQYGAGSCAAYVLPDQEHEMKAVEKEEQWKLALAGMCACDASPPTGEEQSK
jgi:hypothetical protein